MLRRIFTSHPATVGETYFQHQRVAFGFGASMLAAGCAAVVHGLIPCLFKTTGSRAIVRLHARLNARARHSLVA